MGNKDRVHPVADESSVGGENATKTKPLPEAVNIQAVKSPEQPLCNLTNSKFIPKALGCLTLDNPFRAICLRIVQSKKFDYFVMIFIVLNSIALALVDYGVVDDTGTPTATGYHIYDYSVIDDDKFSWRNNLLDVTEYIFSAVFILECVLKVCAYGFILGKNTYLRDGWNCLDFIVVVAGLVEFVLPAVNVSALRLFRILRPLKTLSKIPGLRTIISALLNSVAMMGNIVFLLFFAMMVFGIMGIQFFQGEQHARCRLTPYPVKLNASCQDALAPCWATYIDTVTASPAAWRCLEADNDGFASKAASAWTEPQDCVWPIDGDESRVCSLGGAGLFSCPTGQTCGSNYDDYGNRRFVQTDAPYGYNRMWSGTFTEDLNWGYTCFDNVFLALLAIFQSITMEGWVDICYQCMDAVNGPASALIFVVMIMFGSFIMLNLMLGVITQSINDEEEREEAEGRRPSREASLTRAREQAVARAQAWDPAALPPWRARLLAVVEHPAFSAAIMGVILLNTVTLAMDKYPIDAGKEDALERINYVLTLIFTAEMALALLTYYPREYFRHSMNKFDAFIVVTSLIELIMAETSDASSGGLSALRTFRLFRVFKLAKNWRDLQVLLQTALQTFLEIGNFAILLSLFLYIFALVGMQMFANRMHFDPDTGAAVAFNDPGYDASAGAYVPRLNYDRIHWALLTVFQILSGENWNSVMYDCWRATNAGVAVLYFLALVIVGGFIVMNLFLAILLNNFEGNEDLISGGGGGGPGLGAQVLKKLSTRGHLLQRLGSKGRLAAGEGGGGGGGGGAAGAAARGAGGACAAPPPPTLKERLEMTLAQRTSGRFVLGRGATAPAGRVLAGADDGEGGGGGGGELSPGGSHSQSRDRLLPPGGGRKQTAPAADADEEEKAPRDSQAQAERSQLAVAMEHRSLWLFDGGSRPRQLAARLVQHPAFDKTIVSLIVISSITLALDNPLSDPDSVKSQVLAVVDVVFAAIFTAECLLKVVTLGFLLHRGAYLRNSWNVLDFVIVVVALLDLGQVGPGSSLKTLRTIRVLRPLRMISRQPELKRVVNVIIKSTSTMVKVVVIVMLFFLIYGILGVNYLKGSLNACQGDAFDALSAAQLEVLENLGKVGFADLNVTQQGLLAGCGFDLASTEPYTSEAVCGCWCGEGAWDLVLPLSFDDVASAMGLLYEISTTEGWSDYMFAAIDQRGIGYQPVENWQPAWMLYFVVFVVLGCFFFTNLFVGTIIDFFNRERKASNTANLFMTAEQEQWAKTQKLIQRIRPKRQYPMPQGRLRLTFFNVMTHPQFDNFTMGCIMVNSVVMAMNYFGQSDGYTLALEVINYIFAAYFTAEAVIKLVAIYPQRYFKDGWNRFDFLIVLGTDVGLIIRWSTGTNIGSVASVIRLFRLGRIFRLINSLQSLKKLFNALVTSLPSYGNICALLLLLYFIYAVCGVQLFAKIASNDDYTQTANFRYFWYAMLTLFRFSTGENWNGFMHSIMDQPDGCEADPSFDPTWCEITKWADGCTPINGCGTTSAVPYFYSFTIVVTFSMMNLFIGVILESIEEDDHEDEVLSQEHLEIFAEDWAKFDPDATFMMDEKVFPDFLQILDEPMGFGEGYHATEKEVQELIAQMDLEPVELVTGQRVYVYEKVATALAKRVVIKKQGEKFQELPEEHSLNRKPNLPATLLKAKISLVMQSQRLGQGAGKAELSLESSILSEHLAPLGGGAQVTPVDGLALRQDRMELLKYQEEMFQQPITHVQRLIDRENARKASNGAGAEGGRSAVSPRRFSLYRGDTEENMAVGPSPTHMAPPPPQQPAPQQPGSPKGSLTPPGLRIKAPHQVKTQSWTQDD